MSENMWGKRCFFNNEITCYEARHSMNGGLKIVTWKNLSYLGFNHDDLNEDFGRKSNNLH